MLALALCASVFEQGTETLSAHSGMERFVPREEREDLLVDGGLKWSELGSCSASVALGSEVAISPPLMDLFLGNNSAANKTGRQQSLWKI